MNRREIAILGGTGFVGRHLINELSRGKVSIRVATRHRERHRNLLVNPKVKLTELDIHDENALEQFLKGADVVINLIGILHGTQAAFRKTHVELPEKIVRACNRLCTPRLIHISALQAGNVNALSHYLRSKGEGESVIHHQSSHKVKVTSFRPSVLFGDGDSFFNRFAGLLQLPMIAVPLACPESRFAPIYVGDLARVIVSSIGNPATYGKRFDLCGPKEYTLMELMEITERTIGVRRLIVGLNDTLSRLMAKVLGRLPGQLMSYDNYLSLQLSNTCKESFPSIFQITRTPLEGVIPTYLGRSNRQQRYMSYRLTAKR